MGFGEAISSGFRNYVNFSGRAPRSEYWFWSLFTSLVSLAAGIFDLAIAAGTGFSPFSTIAGLGLILPGIAVSVRRLHDLDRTGWWLLLIFTGIGGILLLIWDCMKGTDGPNRFGSDPVAGKV
jgi:uncharacterized membrane protein YhaH (DUF805 family)